jgi:hypothetical protein
MVYIEAAVPITEVATAMKSTPAKVRDECREFGVFIGENWSATPVPNRRCGTASEATRALPHGGGL